MTQSQLDCFGTQPPPAWVVFHDESRCAEQRFLYHGFLFVDRGAGRAILNRLLKPDPESSNNYAKRVHFQELRGLVGVRAKAALRWVQLAGGEWLPRGSIRFYCLGVNLANIRYELFRDSDEFSLALPSREERVYRRFYEIGLRSALAWFAIPNEQVSHLYYDQGKQDIDRYNKTIDVCGPYTRTKPLHSDCGESQRDISKYLQLADVLLGTIRKTFSCVARGAQAQAACVRDFQDVVERFVDSTQAYNPQSRYYKKFGLSFFPSHKGITADEFFDRDLEYHRKGSNLFYCNRKTYRQREALKAQIGLFEDGSTPPNMTLDR